MRPWPIPQPPPADARAEAASDMEGAGRRVIDGFDLVEKVASGGSTTVWEVLERATGQTHAMKLLEPSLTGDKDQIATLKHEGKVGAAFNHPSVIHTGGFVKTKANVYLIMELFKHPNLKGAVKGDPAGTKALVQKIVEGVCQGLAHMHDKGWLHLDVKPDNLLVAPTGEVRVIDFSLCAKPAGGLSGLFGGSSDIRGTRTYIAPETLLKKSKTPATDVYSLGVTLFELLCGRPPFAGTDPAHLLRQHVKVPPPPPSHFNENLTADADRLITKMLAKKPADRQQTATEVYAEFRGATLFKTDPNELLAAVRKKAEEQSLDAASRLDSRADAVRTAKGIKPPPKPAPKKPRRSRLEEKKPAPAPQRPPQGQPAPQYAPPPGYPQGYPPPGYYPQPQYAPPPYAQGQPGPGQYPQGQYPQGQSPQGQRPAGQAPPQGAPGVPAQQRPAGQPPQPPAPQPPGAAKPAGSQVQVPGLTRPTEQKHASQKQAEDDDLPLMTELPDIV